MNIRNLVLSRWITFRGGLGAGVAHPGGESGIQCGRQETFFKNMGNNISDLSEIGRYARYNTEKQARPSESRLGPTVGG